MIFLLEVLITNLLIGLIIVAGIFGVREYKEGALLNTALWGGIIGILVAGAAAPWINH